MNPPKTNFRRQKNMNTQENKPTPHPHAEMIKAWADGAKIQYFDKTYQTWIDVACNHPSWSKIEKYRIKPEAWLRHGIQYFFVTSTCTISHVEYSGSDADISRLNRANCFRSKEEAEAAAERVKAALKGTTDVSGNVGSPELDGKPLSDGEKAMIKALRKTWGFAEIIKPGDAVVVSKNKNGVYKSTTHNISLLLIDGEGSDAEIVEALKVINEEHKIDNERALKNIEITAGKGMRNETKPDNV